MVHVVVDRDMSGASGVAVYFPSSRADYKPTAFRASAGDAVPDWIAFLDAFFAAVAAVAAAGKPLLFVENTATPDILPSSKHPSEPYVRVVGTLAATAEGLGARAKLLFGRPAHGGGSVFLGHVKGSVWGRHVTGVWDGTVYGVAQGGGVAAPLYALFRTVENVTEAGTVYGDYSSSSLSSASSDYSYFDYDYGGMYGDYTEDAAAVTVLTAPVEYEPLPSPPSPTGASSSSSAMTHSVVNTIPEMETAFSNATRVTFVGSMTPASKRFSYTSVRAL